MTVTAPPYARHWATTRLRLQGRLIEIRDADLRFTPEEAAAFLNERMGLTLPPEMVDRLAE
jgi:LuxR family maltose regulon positive regulatory protein